MPRDDFILFLDCEMTGNEPYDQIIEIGLSLVETSGLTEHSFFSAICVPSDESWARMMITPKVRNMHTENGLVAEIDFAREHRHRSGGDRQWTWAAVDTRINDWLLSVLGADKTHVPYGGSGVSHFDRPYINRSFPLLAKRLTYWAFDVGPTRRMYEMLGKDWPSQDGKTHRALDDARFHASEFRYALEQIRGMG